MNWPSPCDYQDVIQNPSFCFQDPELTAGTVVLTPSGMPKVASGAFASVYEMRTGSHRWAVRCFLRQVSDQQRRYSLLSQTLECLSLPYLVPFEYLSQGIRVRGQMYPIVKMGWVEGEPFDTFVESNLHDPKVLRSLASKWIGLANTLRGSHFAHGDLQHGNVMVTAQAQFQLVDYDAMFVPSLRGERSPELGQVNYQHPQRNPDHYDEWLDNFSALVIYTSLRALAVDPNLWGQFNTGENLVLSASDYKDPSKSPVLKRLKMSPDKGVGELATKLECCLSSPVSKVPDLADLVATLPPPPQHVMSSWVAPTKHPIVAPVPMHAPSVQQAPLPSTISSQQTFPLSQPNISLGAATAIATASPTLASPPSNRAHPKVVVAWIVIALWVVGAMISAVAYSGRRSNATSQLSPSLIPSAGTATSKPKAPRRGPRSISKNEAIPGAKAASPFSEPRVRTETGTALPNPVAADSVVNPKTAIRTELTSTAVPIAPPPAPLVRVSLEGRIQNASLKDASLVEVRIDNERAEASLSPGDGSALFTVTNVSTGWRRIEIKHPNYEPWKNSVSVLDRNNRPLEVQLVPKPATLVMEVTPHVDYALYWNGGRVQGKNGQFTLPAESELALEVRAKDYEVADRTLQLSANGREVWQVSLTPVRASLYGNIRNAALKNPSPAEIMIDGVKADVSLSFGGSSTLFTITNVQVGSRMVEIKHPDYETWHDFVSVSDRNARPFEVQLVPKPAMLVVEVTPQVNYALYSNGGPVLGKDGRFTLPAERDLTLQVRAKDYEVADRKLQLSANGREVWQIALTPVPKIILFSAAKQINPTGYLTTNQKRYLLFGLPIIGKRVAEGETIPIQYQGADYQIEVSSISPSQCYTLSYKGQSFTVRMQASVPRQPPPWPAAPPMKPKYHY